MLGVFRNPKTLGTKCANVVKALELLKDEPNIGREFLNSVDDIVQGDRVSILGLLEDVRRWYEGAPVRRVGEEQPYLGAESKPVARASKPSDQSEVPQVSNVIKRSKSTSSPLAQGLALGEITVPADPDRISQTVCNTISHWNLR